MAGWRRDGARCALVLGLALALLGPIPVPAQPSTPILVLSRDQVLHESRAGKALAAAEERLTRAFQERVDAAKKQFEAEEAELARLRGTLPEAEFEQRTAAFDRKVRATRRESQRRAAELQTIFRKEREKLNRALVPILIAVLKDHGADIVLDSREILVARPGADITAEVIERFDARVEPPEIDPGTAPSLPVIEPGRDGG